MLLLSLLLLALLLSLRESADPDCLNFSLANVLYFEVGSFDLTGLLYYCYFILLVFGVDGRWSYGHFMRYVFFYWILLVGSHLWVLFLFRFECFDIFLDRWHVISNPHLGMKLLQFWYVFHGFVLHFWSFLTTNVVQMIQMTSKGVKKT